MKMITVRHRSEDLIEQLTELWEKSVKASHLFLSAIEIGEIRKDVPQALRAVHHLVIAVSEEGSPVGFMGTAGRRLEMLFIEPEECGKGLGKRFIRHGVDALSVTEVTVNEQNPGAVGFYEHMGFKAYKRTDVDEQGRPYPLLYMKLQAKDDLMRRT